MLGTFILSVKMFVTRDRSFKLSFNLSKTLQKLDPSEFKYTIFETQSTVDMIFTTAIKHFAETVSEWDGYEHYVPHLENLRGSFQSKLLKTFKPNRAAFGFNVLNHADFHVRNLLFKKDAGDNIEDSLFVRHEFRFDGW